MATEQLKGTGRYLSFPFRMTAEGGAQSSRLDHIREQIAQVLLTGPGERVFVKEFGLGVTKLLFLPMTPELWSRIEGTLATGIADVLKGEAEPGSISVTAGPAVGREEQLNITVRYKVAALNRQEELQFSVSNGQLAPPGSVTEVM